MGEANLNAAEERGDARAVGRQVGEEVGNLNRGKEGGVRHGRLEILLRLSELPATLRQLLASAAPASSAQTARARCQVDASVPSPAVRR